MKKVVVILSVFAAMVTAMVCEIVFVNRFYNDIQSDLQTLAVNIERNEGDLDNNETNALCAALLKKWENGKRKLLTVQNHNTIRNLDEKIITLAAVVKSNNYDDAIIYVRSAINYIDDVLLDSIPFLSNLL